MYICLFQYVIATDKAPLVMVMEHVTVMQGIQRMIAPAVLMNITYLQ